MDLTKYGPYRTPHEIYEHFRSLMTGTPGADEINVGETTLGRPLYAWRAGAVPDAPAVLYFAGCHAVEFIGVEQCAATAEHIIRNRPDLLEKISVWFFPVMNPDGHYRVRDLLRRRCVPLVKTNARRVDLNRNFPVGFYEPHKFGIMSGSHRKIINYHGPAPLSEPESRALVKIVDAARPALALQFHSFGEKILFPPCHRKEKTPHHDTFMRLGAEMAARQRKPYAVASCADGLYSTYGDIDDWLYYDRGALAFTMEIGSLGIRSATPASLWNIFLWSNPPDVRPALENNTPASLVIAEAATGL